MFVLVTRRKTAVSSDLDLIDLQSLLFAPITAEIPQNCLKHRTLNANQIHFIQWIVSHLTEKGAMAATRLYESPFTDINDQSIDGLFDQESVRQIAQVLEQIRMRAAV